MTEEKHTPVQDTGSDKPWVLVYGTIADTTFRMFIPVLSLTLIGYGVDKLAATRPIGILIGMCLGIVIAVLLVFMQLKNVKSKGGK